MDIRFERLHNFRDLGGWTTADGLVTRQGVLWRSDSLGALAGADLDRFCGLGVRTVIDLRYPWEIAVAGRVPLDLAYHNLSIEHRPYDQAAVSPDVEPAGFFADRYAEVAADGAAEIRDVLRLIAGDARLPLVFHCKSGKDRTGIIAALVLSLLGVPREDVVTDFARSNAATGAVRAEHVANGRPLPAWPGFGAAPADAMRAFLGMLDDHYGGPAAYLGTDGLTERLRDRLLVSRDGGPE